MQHWTILAFVLNIFFITFEVIGILLGISQLEALALRTFTDKQFSEMLYDYGNMVDASAYQNCGNMNDLSIFNSSYKN